MSNNSMKVNIDFITAAPDGTFNIEGFISETPATRLKVWCDNKEYTIKTIDRAFLDKNQFAFTVKINSKNIKRIIFLVDGKKTRIETRRWTQLGNISGAYRVINHHMILRKYRKFLSARRYNLALHIFYEISFLIRILFNLRIACSIKLLKKKSVRSIIKSIAMPLWSFVGSLYAIFLRTAYHLMSKVDRIWLFADRDSAAGDNGEAFFRYISSQQDNIKSYFIIDKKSSDFSRLSSIGRINNNKGFRYKLLFLTADKFFLSHPELHTMNPFGGKIDCYADLIKVDFVFLQHGITKDDISAWINRYEMNFKLIVTSLKPEYDSFLSPSYGYNKSNLIKCGMPRYDLLTNAPANKIIIMPTWRKNLAGDFNNRTKQRDYNSNFKKSEYYAFYHNLLNDKVLQKVMNEHNLTGEFYLHPALEAQIKDFSSSGSFRIMSPPYDYKRVFSEGNLLITDHSSASFDFAYLKKPVLYCHFDIGNFYSGNHIFSRNFIPDSKFGMIVKDPNSVVAEIIKQIQNGCEMNREHVNHIDSLYFFRDHKNCERLLAAIQNYDKSKSIF